MSQHNKNKSSAICKQLTCGAHAARDLGIPAYPEIFKTKSRVKSRGPRDGHKPNDELDRISTLQSLNILDTKPEATYDDT